MISIHVQAQANDTAPKQAIKVLTQSVQYTENNRIFEAVGTGRAKYSADIYPSIAEEVTAVHFEAGQNVRKGDVLVELDNRNEKLAVQLAEVELKDAQSLFKRYQSAGKEGAVPQSEVDSAKATYDSALVALEQAKLDLQERQIIAPFDGVVGIPGVDIGERIDSTTLITGLDARDTLYVDFDVPEALAASLKKAQDNNETIFATTPSYPDKQFEGYLTAQQSRVNAQTRTIKARASIENTDDLLRPGMSFTVRWNISGAKYATVPEIALQWGRDGSFIWLVRDGKAVKVMGRVVARKGGQVLLDGNIQEQEAVVVEGLHRLRDGVQVERITSQDAEQAQ